MRTYRPFSKIIAPNRTSFLTIGSKIFLLLILMYAQVGKGQSITISNFNMPDSVFQNSFADVQFTIQNTSDTINILGNLKLNFRNETLNNQTEPLGGFNAIQFIAPLQTRTFNTIVPITPQYFLEGGNTVVIWPSFVGQPVAADDSIRFNIFVENLIGFNSVQSSSSFIIQNPVGNKLQIQAMGKVKLPKQICIRDLQGKTLLNIEHYIYEDIDMSGIAPGIYFLEMLLEDGRSINQRIIRSDN
jgi:hypothetical protein